MHALITGGAGSIGSRLAAALIERGDRVTVVDVRAEPVAPSAAFERADVRVGETQAPGFIDGIVAETRPDSIYHLASLLSGSSETDSELAWRVNLDGIRHVLEAARIHGVGRVLFPSSVATFGLGVGDTVTDDSPAVAGRPVRRDEGAGGAAGGLLLPAFRRGLSMRSALGHGGAHGAGGGRGQRVRVRALHRGRSRGRLHASRSTRTAASRWSGWTTWWGRCLQLHDAPASSLSRRVYQVMGSNPTVQDMADAVQSANAGRAS